jgi:hypothetical protein
MRRLLLLLVLAASAATAKPHAIPHAKSATSTPPPAAQWDAPSNAGGAAAANMVRPAGATETVTRNSAESVWDGTTLTSVSANQLACLSTGAGCGSFGSYVEQALYTDTLDGTWSNEHGGAGGDPGAIVQSTVSGADPTGATSTIAVLAIPAITGENQYARLAQPIAAISGVTATGSVFIKADSVPCDTYFQAYDNSGGAPRTNTLVHAVSSWQRVTATATVTNALGIQVGVNTNAWSGHSYPLAACTVRVWRANATATPVAMPPVAATTTSVSVPATVRSADIPTIAVDKVFFGIRATSANWSADDDDHYMLSTNSNGGNYAYLDVYSSYVEFEVTDPGGYRVSRFLHGYTNGTEHVIVCQQKTMNCWSDGVLQTPSYTAGTGTGWTLLPSTIRIGSNATGAGGARPANAFIKGWRIGSSAAKATP